MINLTKDEFSEVVAESIKELTEAVGDELLLPVLVTFSAVIGAKSEIKTEANEAKKKNEEFKAAVEYNVGNKNISITTMANDKVRLVIKCNGIVAVDRTLDSLYKAYHYAFNIICS